MTNKPKRTKEEKEIFLQEQIKGIESKMRNLEILKVNLETKLLNLQNTKVKEGESQ